jgi:hypothetical protein
MEKFVSSKFGNFAKNQITNLQNVKGGQETGPGWAGNSMDGYVTWTGDSTTANGDTSCRGTTFAASLDQCVSVSTGSTC